ncbi:SUMF1/EgtB/PvdO family nonheme iron enzyme [candidate division KSB1 bacterium]|nr:SUMF1/EgtB/PvdO family nonheme iron enzyme [candidate division KSB1 bacterium]
MPVTLTSVAGWFLSPGTGIIGNLTSNVIWTKFEHDLETVIVKLIDDRRKSFAEAFPKTDPNLKPEQIKASIFKFADTLTAEQLEAPLSTERVVEMFTPLFIKSDLLDPATNADNIELYQQKLKDEAEIFLTEFRSRSKLAFERHPKAATALLINSMEQAGKDLNNVKMLLNEIRNKQVGLPDEITQLLSGQITDILKTQIESLFNQFGDWDFIIHNVQGEISPEQEREREWLEQLAQALAWSDFRILSRCPEKRIPGEFFRLEEKRRFGEPEQWLCWGCPTADVIDESKLHQALSIMAGNTNTHHIVVFRATISESIRQLLAARNIKYQTLDALIQSVLDISPYRQTILQDYQAKPIFQNYIALQCHRPGDEKIPRDLQTEFCDWLKQAEGNHISLLGTFGTGKTEFCSRMEWMLLNEYNRDNHCRIPVVITLREQKHVSLPQMLASIMNRMGLKQIDYPAFRTLNRMGMFVVLIDGFDEMATHANTDAMIEQFRKLAVLAEGRAKVFLTCRTNYFETETKAKQVMSLPDYIAERPEFQIRYLNQFTDDQIKTYLDTVKGLRGDKRDILAEMERHPRLKELMQTPVLLDMILKIFPDLMEKQEPITMSLVYKTATERWIATETRNERLQKVKPDEALAFMQELGWQMHRDNSLKIHFQDLKNRTYENFKQRMKFSHELDALWGEIRTCTFLTCDSLGNYQFAHKSFMEYFTACYLEPALRAEKSPDCLPVIINDEIRQFLHYLLLNKVDYNKLVKDSLPTPLWPGMKRCDKHSNCFIHAKDHSHMAWIPPGPFIAGGELDNDEKPTRIMNLEQGGFLDRFLVTNSQFVTFLNEAGACDEKWIDLKGSYKNEQCRIKQNKGTFTVETGYDNHPVNFVSYHGAEAYAAWAGKTIPTEWLWEKAGRGIDGRTFPWGDDWDWEKCNSGEHWANRDLSDYEAWEKLKNSEERMKAIITAVDQFSEFDSPFGCSDLSGNLWEWMMDWWDKDKDRRIVRGGAFSYDRSFIRLPCRVNDVPGLRIGNQGFRLSRTS